MAIKITREVQFDAGHRILGHESKCRHIHGHRYRALITVTADNLDSIGRIVDFGTMKGKVGKWIDDFWDHNILLHTDDPLLKVDRGVFAGKDPYVLDCNPTAENMARHLCQISEKLLEASVVQVQIFETPNCSAIYESQYSTT